MGKKVTALVATTSDPRYQETIHQWLVRTKLYGEHIRLSLFGCVKDRETLMKTLRLSKKYFGISQIHLINAYGDIAYADRKFPSADIEKEAHLNDLRNTKAAIHAELSSLSVHLYYISKGGTIERVSE